MAEIVSETLPRGVPRYAEPQQKVAARKTAPSQFPIRTTFCIAPDQAETLKRIKVAFRCTESFALRMALDAFARNNGFVAVGDQHGQR